MDNLEKLTDFFVESNKLKRTMRYSSCPPKIQESSAGHSWQVSLMVPIIAREFGLALDVQHAMEIANVHDLAEYIDEKDFDSYLIATGVLSEAEKDKSEESVMTMIRERYNFGSTIYSLWREYQDCKIPEARYVKALDKLESHLHVIERDGTGSDSFDARHQALYADEAVRNFPELKPFLRAIKKRLRAVLEKQGLVWKEEYNYPD